jgi:hypothetical protein
MHANIAYIVDTLIPFCVYLCTMTGRFFSLTSCLPALVVVKHTDSIERERKNYNPSLFVRNLNNLIIRLHIRLDVNYYNSYKHGLYYIYKFG